ncbi:MAG TPA: anhydro-N-acetylmuramic acid kinase [Bacteroidales bacterium]|nr:anhydro-N-acetylmuramic acid kinase [Bacteroidales bacterium]
MEKHTGIGIMSGTSLDGLDLACCSFSHTEGRWHYEIEQAVTIPYPDKWRKLLLGLPQQEEKAIMAADIALGDYIGRTVSEFIKTYKLSPAFIASHGHTIFHQPEKGITLQIGAGNRIAKACGIKVICDFRSSDVAMGGQGAPLVPIGDRLLFADYEYCLNIGGIANISFEDQGERIAFDICPANMVLNELAGKAGKAYDDKGMMAAGGNIIPGLMDQLEALPYYTLQGPRSLGREWVEENIFILLKKIAGHPLPDLLNTFTEHIAFRVAAATLPGNEKHMLVSGGGAYNDYLIKRIKLHCGLRVIIPEAKVVEFKEALVFAFLGLLRLRGEVNVLGSVTGSGTDHCAGTVYE